MSNIDIAQKVWEELYPDRRPWAKLESDTQAEWSRMVAVVRRLACAPESRDLYQHMQDVAGAHGFESITAAITQAVKMRELARELRDALGVMLDEYEAQRNQYGTDYLWKKYEGTEAISNADAVHTKAKEVLP